MEIRIDMNYLVNTLHLGQDIASAIYHLKEGDGKVYHDCLSELQDHNLKHENAEIAMLCLEAKLRGQNTITI